MCRGPAKSLTTPIEVTGAFGPTILIASAPPRAFLTSVGIPAQAPKLGCNVIRELSIRVSATQLEVDRDKHPSLDRVGATPGGYEAPVFHGVNR